MNEKPFIDERREESSLGESPITVRDVTEATGVPEGDVGAHVRRLRAEAGFRGPEAARPSALPWIAAGTLVVGIGVTWWRIHRGPFDAPSSVALTYGSPTILLSERTPLAVRQSPTTTPFETDNTHGGVVKPPPGLRVEAIGQRTELSDEAPYEEKGAVPYDVARERLVQATEALVVALDRAEGTPPRAPEGTRYRGKDGEIFSPRTGFARVSMSGWAGGGGDWIALPLTETGKAKIRALAKGFLSDAKKTQDESLHLPADPREGIVTPPPGFTLRFAGRRFDYREGPRVSFSDVPSASVTRRLEAALLNAAYRDRRLPVGTWTGDPAQDAKTPIPALSRAEVRGPKGLLAADLPTAEGGEAATRRAIHEFAERAAKGIEKENEEGRGSDATGEP